MSDKPKKCVVCDCPLSRSTVTKGAIRCNSCVKSFGVDSKTWCVICKARRAGVVCGRCPQHALSIPIQYGRKKFVTPPARTTPPGRNGVSARASRGGKTREDSE